MKKAMITKQIKKLIKKMMFQNLESTWHWISINFQEDRDKDLKEKFQDLISQILYQNKIKKLLNLQKNNNQKNRHSNQQRKKYKVLWKKETKKYRTNKTELKAKEVYQQKI